jgi:hypothetical protein
MVQLPANIQHLELGCQFNQTFEKARGFGSWCFSWNLDDEWDFFMISDDLLHMMNVDFSWYGPFKKRSLLTRCGWSGSNRKVVSMVNRWTSWWT